MANTSPSPGETTPASPNRTMIGRFVAIAALLIALATLMVALFSWPPAGIAGVSVRDTSLDNRITTLEDRMGDLEQRVARQEGVTTGILLLVKRRLPRRAPEGDNGQVE